MAVNHCNLQDFIFLTIPRILSQQDRDPSSSTYGSFDRNFWQYKIRDFSSAILQQSSLSLALLYSQSFPGNSYYKNSCLKQWSIAALNFLEKIQLSDGSFNEYYPNEHSFPATSFNLFAGTKTYQLLKLNQSQLLKAFLKSAHWLEHHRETQALNQEAATFPGLSQLYQLTQEKWLKKLFRKKIDWFLQQQNPEGWFREYGGLDAGYLSTTLEFLVEYWQQNPDKKIWQAIEKIVQVLQYLIHPDGTIGGQYTSRHTTYLCLGGLAKISQKLPLAQAILQKTIASPTPFWQNLDDRYLTHNLLYSLITVQINLPKNNEKSKLPCEKDHQNDLDQAGIFTKKTKKYFCVIGTKKGGVIYIWKNNKPHFIHPGWEIILLGKKIAVTNWLQDWQVTLIEKPDSLSLLIIGPAIQVQPKKPSLLSHFLLRISSLLLQNKLIPLLKNQLIFPIKKSPINFQRRVDLYQNKIQINDQLTSDSVIMEKVYPASNFSKRHIASSNFNQSLDQLALTKPVFISKKQVRWQKTISFK